jgi:hypothetical protein
MPFDDFNPYIKHSNNASLIELAKIIGEEKCLWAACRNQSEPIEKVPGIYLTIFECSIVAKIRQ